MLVVSALGILLDIMLVKEGLPRFFMLVISNTLTGVFAGGFFYKIVREEKANRDLMRARMKTIAELNHHIRNALQVIKFWGVQQRPGPDVMQIQLINDSVDRIEWALREVLPQYPMDAMATQQSKEPPSHAHHNMGPAA
jgi:hypothetical protein